jgi:hypothetical protein
VLPFKFYALTQVERLLSLQRFRLAVMYLALLLQQTLS